MRYFDSFWRGPAYAEKLKNKMANVEIASQAMDERGIQSGQLWLKEIRDVTVHSMVTLHPLEAMKLTPCFPSKG